MQRSAEITQLRLLTDDPEAQAAYAASLLLPAQSRLVLQAALDVLKETPLPDARPALLAAYDHLAANGPKRDPGAFLRRALLDALRPVALPADVALLTEAVTTYERLPPDFAEEAGLLRGGALIVLNELNEALAGFFAARLLVDRYTEEMSGEPAVTAARVLASQDQLIPLFQVAMLDVGNVQPEVVAECLRNLTALPPDLVPGIVDHFKDATSPVILLGLFDLLIGHEAGPQAPEYVEESLVKLKDPDLFRYLLTALLAARNQELNELVVRGARFETDQAKIAVLLEVLPLFDLGLGAADLISRLQSRVR